MRIVSLVPAATEWVAALGMEKDLVGVSHECDWPPSTAALPRVTSTPVSTDADASQVDAEVRALAASGEPVFGIDAALLEELDPDVIITQRLCDVCAVSDDDVRDVAERLTSAPAVVALAATTFDGIFDDLAVLADALGVPDRAVVLSRWLHDRLENVHRELKASRAPRPTVAVIEWTDPVYVAGHWVPDLVHRAGGRDVLAEPGAHSTVRDMAGIAAADPDILVFAPCGYDAARAAAEARRALARSEWSWATECAIWAVNANALTSRPGPRIVDGVETFAAICNPPLFDPLPKGNAIELTAGGTLVAE